MIYTTTSISQIPTPKKLCLRVGQLHKKINVLPVKPNLKAMLHILVEYYGALKRIGLVINPKTLAEQLWVSPTTVRRMIKKLVEQDWLIAEYNEDTKKIERYHLSSTIMEYQKVKIVEEKITPPENAPLKKEINEAPTLLKRPVETKPENINDPVEKSNLDKYYDHHKLVITRLCKKNCLTLADEVQLISKYANDNLGIQTFEAIKWYYGEDKMTEKEYKTLMELINHEASNEAEEQNRREKALSRCIKIVRESIHLKKYEALANNVFALKNADELIEYEFDFVKLLKAVSGEYAKAQLQY